MSELTIFPDYKRISLSSLIPYARNSRTHSDAQVAQIASSIKEFGFTNPVLVDEQGGIIAGHGRVLAAQKLNYSEVPAIVLSHLTETQKRAYVIADNKLALNAGWDDEMLRIEFAELSEAGFDLELTGFSLEEIDGLNIEEIPEGLTDEDAVPEAPETPVSKLGDVWVLGNHRLMCGDSTSIDAVEKMMDGQKADMAFTDPPYNVAYEGKTKDSLKIQNDNMGNDQFRQFLDECFSCMFIFMNEGAPIYVTCPLEDGNFQSAFMGQGFKLQSILVWVKNTMVMGRKDYHYKHEPIIYGWKPGAAHFWKGGRDKTSVINCDKPPRNGEHPTMKPVELIEKIFDNSLRTDAIVMDLFGGSGSTLIACEKQKANARLMEIDPKYVDVIIKRWQDFTGKQATHEETGKTYAELANDS